MLTIVIPMAGRGSRFAEAGYELPKPLLPIHGIPMIEAGVRNLVPSEPARFVFICQREHLASHGFEAGLRRAAPGRGIAAVHGGTAGAPPTLPLCGPPA